MLVSIVAVSSSSIHSVFTPTHCDPCDWATSLCCCCLGFHQRIQVPLCWRTFQSSLEDEPPYLTEFKRNSASDKTQGCFSRTGHWDAVVRPFSKPSGAIRNSRYIFRWVHVKKPLQSSSLEHPLAHKEGSRSECEKY